MLKTLADIQAYFRHLADISPDIQEFVVGDSEQVLSIDRSAIQYPVLWLETPSVGWSFSNVGQREYQFFFVVLTNTTADSWQHQQYILHRTLEITSWIIAKMRDDHLAGIIQASAFSASSDPILAYGHDHDYGWRTRLSITSPIGPCPDCHFPDPCPAGALAAFTWSNEAAGSFGNLVIEDTSNYAEATGWAAEWSWQIDGGAVNTSPTAPGPALGAGDYILITLSITRGDCTKQASALIPSNAANCGESVPTLLKTEYS